MGALADWSNFFVAEVGAAAALTGLVMVAVSINLAQVLAVPTLPGRAAETLFLLMGVFAPFILMVVLMWRNSARKRELALDKAGKAQGAAAPPHQPQQPPPQA